MPKSLLWKIGLIPVVVPDSCEERGGAGLGPGGVQDGGGCGGGRQLQGPPQGPAHQGGSRAITKLCSNTGAQQGAPS